MLMALLRKRPENLKDDLLSGLTVALALVPEAVAFALIAGVPIMVGLHAAFLIGLIAAIAGGRPGMISGATGAMAVVLLGLQVTLRESLGLASDATPAWYGPWMLQHVYLAIGCAGLIQISAGLLRLGKFIRMVPHSVMLGFVNGLAIIIFKAQLASFHDPVSGNWLPVSALAMMLALVALTMSCITLLPRFTNAIPAPLAGILVSTVLVIVCGFETPVVADMMDLSGLPLIERLPLPHIPGIDAATIAAAAADGVVLPALWSWTTLLIILPTAGILAAVGLIESLMTMSLIDDITETRGRGNRECLGQGLGNLTCGFFAAMGGCAMIGQSMINIQSGGRGRLSGISAACFLLLLLILGGDLIAMIPIAALIGVMFMVVIGTFEWSSLWILHRVPRSDAVVIILTTIITVVTDNLALAVGSGVIIAALAFAWKHAMSVVARVSDQEDGTRTYFIHGSIFFASVTSFRDCFTNDDDPPQVIIDFAEATVLDHSAIEAIASLTERYAANGRTVRLRHLSPECRSLLSRAKGILDIDELTDPHYHVADDALA